MKRIVVTAQQLVADYQTALAAIASSQLASSEAERSESELLQQLNYWSRGGYLNPGTIDTTQHYDVSRASLDAHVKKIQAQQLTQFTAQQLTELAANAQASFVGKKLRITSLQPLADSPFDVLWFNSYNGFRSNPMRKQSITGVVEQVLLNKNILIIRPPRLPRLLNKELSAYVVYVINPMTMQPAVDICFT